MKRIVSLLICTLFIIGTLFTFTSCSKDTVEDAHIFDVLDQNIIGKTLDEIISLDSNASNGNYSPKQKEKNGYWRLSYTYKYEDGTGDAFVPESGRWITQLKYFFDIDSKTLDSVEIRCMQTDYSEGQCNKRLKMITTYLNERYGVGKDTKIGINWDVGNGVLTMSRQNGGWILFKYYSKVIDTSLFDLINNGIINKNPSEIKNLDPNIIKYTVTEGQQSSYSTLSYTYEYEDGTGDAFIPESGLWKTTVEYDFNTTTNLLNRFKITMLPITVDGSTQIAYYELLTSYINNRYGYGVEQDASTQWTIGQGRLIMTKLDDGSIEIIYSAIATMQTTETTTAQ